MKSGKRVCAVSNAGILEMRGSETVRAHICKTPHYYAINHRGPAFKISRASFFSFCVTLHRMNILSKTGILICHSKFHED